MNIAAGRPLWGVPLRQCFFCLKEGGAAVKWRVSLPGFTSFTYYTCTKHLRIAVEMKLRYDCGPSHNTLEIHECILGRLVAYVRSKAKATLCHAASGHSPAEDHGCYGWLCAACWIAVQKLLKRKDKAHDDGRDQASRS